ncbi:hypothetical protein [Chishuiella sp.]|uniref:hypothetical protein n=1 Tax=Chishuiella sp. TaxID=1969467 RepID=UPI0028AE33B0|nr:hypothetical protein [Chishuiella sp.]
MNKKLALALIAAGMFTFSACNKKSDLPQYKVEQAVLDVYKYRENRPDSLFAHVDGVNVLDLMAPIKEFGPIDVYNVEKVTPLEDGDKTIYEAVYKVHFKNNAEGTETFKVKRVNKLDGIVVGYSYNISQVPLESEKSEVKTDSVK